MARASRPGPVSGTFSETAEGRTLLLFVALTFALTWSAWYGAALVTPAGAAYGALILLGTFAPAIVALGLTARLEGRAGLARIGRQLVRGAVAPGLYLLAVTYMLVIKLLAATGYRLIEGTWPRFSGEALVVIAVAIVISTPAQAGEEIGWRGFALPRLAERIGFRGAAIVVGIVWALWHLPLFYLAGTDKTGQSFPFFLVEITALSVAITWVFARTGGSLLLTMLMHSAINQVVGIVPSGVPGAHTVWTLNGSLVGWLTAALLWVGAAYFLVTMPGAPHAAEASHAAEAPLR